MESKISINDLSKKIDTVIKAKGKLGLIVGVTTGIVAGFIAFANKYI